MGFLLHCSALLTVACVAGLWQGLAIIAIGLALCHLMPRATAAFRHAILLCLFAGALLLPWIHVQHPSGSAAHHALQLPPWMAPIIAVCWLTAVVVRGAQLYVAWRHLSSVRRNAVPLEVQGTTEVRGGRRGALLCSSSQVNSPSILGFGSPCLMLPDWMVPLLTSTDLQQIALHECEHLRRGDDWINLLLQVGMTLAPLNPAMMWLNRQIRVQRELAVDSAVVARTAEPLSYAACLTRLAQHRREQGHLRLAVAAWERRSELAQRVHALLSRPSLLGKKPVSMGGWSGHWRSGCRRFPHYAHASTGTGPLAGHHDTSRRRTCCLRKVRRRGRSDDPGFVRVPGPLSETTADTEDQGRLYRSMLPAQRYNFLTPAQCVKCNTRARCCIRAHSPRTRTISVDK